MSDTINFILQVQKNTVNSKKMNHCMGFMCLVSVEWSSYSFSELIPGCAMITFSEIDYDIRLLLGCLMLPIYMSDIYK